MVVVRCGSRGVAPVLLGDESVPEEGAREICRLKVESEGGNVISYCTDKGYPGRAEGVEMWED